jgi:hypothetical protein
MKSRFINSALFGFVMLASSTVPVSAQPPDKRTVVTFSASVRIDIVQLFNADETRLEATVIADQTSRDRAEDRAQFAFSEAAEGRPPALRTWFGAGDTIGLRFSISKPPMGARADFTRHISAAAKRGLSVSQPGQ